MSESPREMTFLSALLVLVALCAGFSGTGVGAATAVVLLALAALPLLAFRDQGGKR